MSVCRGLFVVTLCLCSCASSPLPEPTPERPLRGCIPATMNQQSHHAGRLLPEPVLIVGHDHDGRWMVLRAGYRSWVPMPKESIRFAGCSQERP
jgi:hypothetical protein